MAGKLDCDVLIVGAGTAGAFTAWKLADMGFSCVVLEKEPLETLGTAIGPFHMEESAFDQFGIPMPAGEEYLHRETGMTMWPPGLQRSVSCELPTLVMDKPCFTRRMQRYAREAEARLLEKTEVDGLLFDGGILSGVSARGEDGPVQIRSRLVIDASGIEGAVRTRMPSTPWFESEPLSSNDTIFVYMESWKDVTGKMGPGVNSFPYYIGWFAPGYGETTILGVGMGGSLEAAKRRHREYISGLPLEGEVVTSTAGLIPYRRPPYSLVDNRLMVVGDAACMNKPFSGEGVTSGFTGCAIASRVASEALSRDNLTRESLWPYNVEYFRGQGAKFAFLMAALPAVLSVSRQEMDLFFDAGLITPESAAAMQEHYEVEVDIAGSARAVPALATGFAGGVLKARSLAKIASVGLAAGRLRSLYEDYPEHPRDLGAFIEKAAGPWAKAEAAKHSYFAHHQNA